MVIATLLTIAKIWKQPKFPSTDEWIKKLWYTYIPYAMVCVCIYIYIYKLEYYLVEKKEQNFLPFAASPDGLGGH